MHSFRVWSPSRCLTAFATLSGCPILRWHDAPSGSLQDSNAPMINRFNSGLSVGGGVVVDRGSAATTPHVMYVINVMYVMYVIWVVDVTWLGRALD